MEPSPLCGQALLPTPMWVWTPFFSSFSLPSSFSILIPFPMVEGGSHCVLLIVTKNGGNTSLLDFSCCSSVGLLHATEFLLHALRSTGHLVVSSSSSCINTWYHAGLALVICSYHHLDLGFMGIT